MEIRVFLFFSFVSFCFCRDSEMQILMEIKSSFTSGTGLGLEDWIPSEPHCSFPGIQCNHDGRVLSLDVSSRPELNGSIPPSIGMLSKLVNLTVTLNSLRGPIPLEIAELKSLKILNLSNNGGLEGSFPGVIFLELPLLEIVDIYNNNFTGSLPVEVAGLKLIKHLHLGGNLFTGEIPDCYSNMTSLEYLGLNGNSQAGIVPASLSNLKNLRELYLGYYSTYEGGIPPEFGDLKSLQVLDMASCNLSGSIPSSLGQLSNLESLFLQLNLLSGSIPPEFSLLESLTTLDLSINQLEGEIPQGFSKLRNLKLIHLFSNKLRGPIPEFIAELPNLEVLHVWGNNFTFELPKNLGRIQRLTFVDVSFNHLTGNIPSSLCDGGNLQALILMNNFFVGTLPEKLGECTTLTRVRIMGNFIGGEIPAGFFNLPAATIVELGDNEFSGEMPAVVSGENLAILVLSNTRLSGKISPAIRGLKNLQSIALDNCNFSGEIPREIFDLKRLTTVNFSSNSLSGDLPDSLAQCFSLISLDLSRNSIAGKIPPDIFDLINLNHLNISRNNLTGEIPNGMQFMHSLTSLDLSFNNLAGIVPAGGQFRAFNDTCFAGNPHLCHINFPCRRVRYGKESGGTRTILVIVSCVVIASVIITAIIIRKKRMNKSRWKLTSFQKVSFKAEDVLACVRDDTVIGKGGAGVVYRGTFPGGDVAIKVLASGVGDHGFSAEVQTLGKIRHRNIVKLVGYVSNGSTRGNMLLYEYMPNGSLGELLHGPKGGRLRWESRYRIAVEAARGLSYLHHDCSPMIIHRDVKSNNILLDADYEAHVSDFGLAKRVPEGASGAMSAVAGSYGYIAPEYAYTLRVDEKSDVYSFGVVLLELVAGRRAVGGFGEGVDIVRWVRGMEDVSDAGTAARVVDGRLAGCPMGSVVHVLRVAMVCVREDSRRRPSMREVVHLLMNPPTCGVPGLRS